MDYNAQVEELLRRQKELEAAPDQYDPIAYANQLADQNKAQSDYEKRVRLGSDLIGGFNTPTFGEAYLGTKLARPDYGEMGQRAIDSSREGIKSEAGRQDILAKYAQAKDEAKKQSISGLASQLQKINELRAKSEETAEERKFKMQLLGAQNKASMERLKQEYGLKKDLEGLKAGARGVSSSQGGKPLAPNVIQGITEGASLPALLKDLESTIESKASVMGPVSGRLRTLNPYDESAQVFNSQMKATAQRVGKYLEGGVLRAEDVPKYAAMLPQMTDTPSIAKQKLKNVDRMLLQKIHADVDALNKTGYDTSVFGELPTIPDLPGLKKKAAVGAKAGGKILVSNGVEQAYIDAKDKEEAEKDGFKEL